MAEYIEREAILNRLNKVHMDNRPFDAGVQFGVDHAISCIIEAPAADVAPVVHGMWVDEDFPGKPSSGNGIAICSVCGEMSHKAEHGYPILSKYCPNCGAKMNGGKA